MKPVLTFVGLKEAQAYFSRLKSGAEAMARIVILVGSAEPYAYGIHYGRHRRGTLARAAGGTNYLEKGLAQRREHIRKAAAAAVEKGPQAVAPAMLAQGQAVASAARPFTPHLSGTLRRSLHAVPGRR